uniref:Ovule protein n=1 Tax=Meloidogyne incognita TaxID=6306 RepID=A0A914NRY6_MELIC
MLRPNKIVYFSLLHTIYQIHSVFRVAFLHINNQIFEVVVVVISHNFRMFAKCGKIVFSYLQSKC